MTNHIRDFARRLAKLEKAARDKGSTPQLGTSSIHDNGTIYGYDLNGSLKTTIGYQHDGTTTSTSQNGPVPPAPSKPVVEVLNGAIRVVWDGIFVETLVAPEDLARIDIRIVPDDVTDPLTVPPSGVLLAQNFGQVPLPLEPGDYYAALISWTQSGAYHVSELSDPFIVTPITASEIRVESSPYYVQVGPDASIDLGVTIPSDTPYGSIKAGPDYLGNPAMNVEATDRLALFAPGPMTGFSQENIDFECQDDFYVETYAGKLELWGGGSQGLLLTSTGSVYSQTIVDATPGTGTDLIITAAGRIAPKSSSERFKTNVEDLQQDEEFINRLRPVSFDYHAGDPLDTPRTVAGLIAEEVYEAGGALFVNLDKNGKPFSLDSQALITALIGAVQSQGKRIEQLEEAVSALSGAAS